MDFAKTISTENELKKLKHMNKEVLTQQIKNLEIKFDTLSRQHSNLSQLYEEKSTELDNIRLNSNWALSEKTRESEKLKKELYNIR